MLRHGPRVMLASLSMLGPFAVDMYLPAFPAIGAAFAVPHMHFLDLADRAAGDGNAVDPRFSDHVQTGLGREQVAAGDHRHGR